MGVNKKSLDNLIYKKPIPVEWNGEWFESQKELTKLLKVSSGRVSANIKAGWKLKGHYVKISSEGVIFDSNEI